MEARKRRPESIPWFNQGWLWFLGGLGIFLLLSRLLGWGNAAGALQLASGHCRVSGASGAKGGGAPGRRDGAGLPTPDFWGKLKRASTYARPIPEQMLSGSSIRKSRLSKQGTLALYKQLPGCLGGCLSRP